MSSTIHTILQNVTMRLRPVTDFPQKEAMVLLAKSLGREISWLVAHSEDVLEVDEIFWEKVKRREKHEPLEYILGHATFYGKDFDVDARVLIPRPETEILVDKVLELTQDLTSPRIVEIGCGSGIVSIMLSLLLPQAEVVAVDISQEALSVAKSNALKHGVFERIAFVNGSYLDGVEDTMDVIVSNPPYIANEEPLGIGLSFEPSVALYGGKRGDEMLCHIIDLFCEKKASLLVCEMGYDQRQTIMEYALKKGFEAFFYVDLAGLDRGFWIRKSV